MSLHQVKDLFCWMLYWKILQILLTTTCSKFFQKPITFLLFGEYRDKLCRSLFNDMPVHTHSWLPSFQVSNPYQIQIYSNKDICQYKRCILDNRCDVNNKLQNVCLITMSNVLEIWSCPPVSWLILHFWNKIKTFKFNKLFWIVSDLVWWSYIEASCFESEVEIVASDRSYKRVIEGIEPRIRKSMNG